MGSSTLGLGMLVDAMAFETSSRALRLIVRDLHFVDDGDPNERRYWPVVQDRFPRCELFWQLLVVPMTRRIECARDNPARYQTRPVADDFWLIAYRHYTLFLQWGAAHDHLAMPLQSSFNDFYLHLGSVCDLAEDFLLHTFLLMRLCRGEKVTTLQILDKEDFLALAGAWYDQHYPALYEHYLRYGKGKPPIPIPSRANVLDEYYDSAGVWREYKRFSQQLRTYRNRIVHDVAVGHIAVGASTWCRARA